MFVLDNPTLLPTLSTRWVGGSFESVTIWRHGSSWLGTAKPALRAFSSIAAGRAESNQDAVAAENPPWRIVGINVPSDLILLIELDIRSPILIIDYPWPDIFHITRLGALVRDCRAQ